MTEKTKQRLNRFEQMWVDARLKENIHEAVELAIYAQDKIVDLLVCECKANRLTLNQMSQEIKDSVKRVDAEYSRKQGEYHD